MSIPATLYDLERADLDALLVGEPAYRLDQIWTGLYGQGRLPTKI